MRFNVFFFVNAKVRTFAAEVQPYGYSGIWSSHIRCNPFLRPDFRKTSKVCHKGTIVYCFFCIIFLTINIQAQQLRRNFVVCCA